MDDLPEFHLNTFAATEVLEAFVPQDQTEEFIRDIIPWRSFIYLLLVYCEGFRLRTIEYLWNWSILKWMIKNPAKIPVKRYRLAFRNE